MLRDFRSQFWQPPRAHGDVIENRTVSFLELFYDLVYVVVIAVAARTLAGGITRRSVGEFVVVFGLIWLAWFNGTVLHDLHGREDIRTRAFTFGQMVLIVVLAVYVGDAGGAGGRGFALVYAGFVALLLWLWYTVRRQDDDRFMSMTRRYLGFMAIAGLVMIGSAFLSDSRRMVVWAVLLGGWLMTLIVLGRAAEMITEQSFIVFDSTVERFGLFTIIVLGEVVVAVVDGLTEADRDLETIVTGLFALVIGFGLWWNYFDLAGRRQPRQDPGGSPIWMVSHFPLALSIAAAGAAMVGLIEHATVDQAPAATTWLLTGSTGLGLVVLAMILRTLQDYERLKAVYRPAVVTMLVAAGAALLLGAWRPAPLVLAAALAAIQSLVWIFAISRQLATNRHRSE